MRQLLYFLSLLIIPTTSIYAQDVTLDGYVFESGNRGYLRGVQIKVKDTESKQTLTKTSSDKEGHFSMSLPVGDFILVLEKDLFHPIQKTITIDGTAPKIFEKIQMERKPGYLLDATIAEKRSNPKQQVDAITNSLIEVFNNTRDELVLILENHPFPTFKTTFERGNHYTLLIRKDGFVPKRLEAYVDIKGCILCFDGVGSIQPGISDVLTESNQMGTFLANIELERLSTKRKSTTFYGDESLVEILFMENLDSEVIEVGADGQITNATRDYTAKPSASKVINSSPSVPINPPIQNKTTQSSTVNRTEETIGGSGERSTITEIIEAPEIPVSKPVSKATTQETKPTKPAVAATDTPSPISQNTEKLTETVNPPKSTKEVPDYKRTSSSASSILSRTNRGETLVKTANNPESNTRNKSSSSPNKQNNSKQGETLVQSTALNNPAEFISPNFTGYLIEILLATKEVTANNSIFKQHSEVKKELRSDGGYSYLVGSFNKKKDASAYLKDIVRKQYPMAKVVYYVNGNFVGYVYIPR